MPKERPKESRSRFRNPGRSKSKKSQGSSGVVRKKLEGKN